MTLGSFGVSLLTSVLTTLAFCGAAGAADDRPNVIFFLSDDQRASFMGCAGHPILRTPTMDRLAKTGLRFTNAFVTTSICAASRATLLTGLWERTHQFTFGTPPIARRLTATAYPAIFRRSGYRTGFVGKFGVGVGKGEQKAMFDYFRPLNRNPYHKKQADGSTRHVSEIAGDLAIEFLQSTPATKSFCLSVSFNAPHAEDSDKENHYPWPKAVDGLYDDVEIPAPRLADFHETQPAFLGKESLNRVRFYWRWDTPQKYARNVRAYYRMISGVDTVMGRVLAALEASGRHKNTVVVFSGDNGYYRGDRGFAGKWSHFEESLRIPLIVYDPRLPEKLRGRTASAMVLNVDIPATLLAAAGLEVPKAYQGRSLMPWVRGHEISDWRTDFFCEHLMGHKQLPRWEGVRGKRWVYARYFEQMPIYEYLHDLKSDPDQLNNLAKDPKMVGRLERMQTRCDALREQLGGAYDPEPLRKHIREQAEKRKVRHVKKN